MALVAHSRLPAFQTLEVEGIPVVAPDSGTGLPQLRVGLLNLMPDAALRATDRQFIRLISAFSDAADLWVYPFTLASEHRGPEARRHADTHYSDFDELRDLGLDALVVTGANPTHHDLGKEAFWPGMVDVLDWAEHNTRGILCSCLATHGVLRKNLATERERLPQKRWGVYSHHLLDDHPLLEGLEGTVVAPHSHWYEVSRERFEAVGVKVLAESDEAGVHMAVSADDFYVFFQGHPEYDAVSLLKEYVREMGRYHRGELDRLPPYPEHYFSDDLIPTLEAHREATARARAAGDVAPLLDETAVLPEGIDTWVEPGRVIYRNWLATIIDPSLEYVSRGYRRNQEGS